jgi:flagellar motor switch protein FliM
MEKVLNQQEIDAMVRTARGSASGKSALPREAVVTPWDARQAGQIGRDQVQSISALHEGFARNLTHSVGAYLRVAFSAALVSAEHLTYGEFLTRVPEVTYLATCKLLPLEAAALLQLDLAVAFPLIDVLLGGEGKGTPPERQITGIEEQIVETVIRILCRELQSAWQILALQVEFEGRQTGEVVQRLMPAEEKTLSLSFEVNVAESRGTLNLVFPAAVSNALLRKMAAARVRAKRRIQPGASQQIRQHLLECPFRLELGMKIASVPVRELMQLVPGKLLALRCPVERPATLRVRDCELFRAAAARLGATRVAHILEPSALAPERRPGL